MNNLAMSPEPKAANRPVVDYHDDDEASVVLAAFLDTEIELPTLPDVAWKVRDAMSNPDIGVDDIAKIVQNDPVIAAKLVQVANSPLYRGMTKVENIRMVVGRLGLKSTQNLVMIAAVQQLFRAQTTMIKSRFKILYQQSTTTAAISGAIADKIVGMDPDRAALCGLLNDIGTIPVLTRADQQPEFFETREQLEDTILEMRAHAGSWLLHSWNFDSEFVEIVRESRNWKRDKIGAPDYCDIVSAALLIQNSLEGNHEKLPDINDLPLGAKLAENGLVIVSYEEFIEEAEDVIDGINAALSS